MATRKLSDKSAVLTMEDDDTIVLVMDDGNVRRITLSALTALLEILPNVTASDNGKALMVVDGEWVAGNLDTLPTATAASNGKVLRVVNGVWSIADLSDILSSANAYTDAKCADTVMGNIRIYDAGSASFDIDDIDWSVYNQGDLILVIGDLN